MRRSRRALLPAAATLLALVIGSTAPAQAVDAPREGLGITASTTTTARLADGTPVDSPESMAALARYWTQERMAKAIPADLPLRATAAPEGPDRSGPTGKPVSVPPMAPRADGENGVQLTSRGVGMVFYTHPADGRDYFCSASALASPSRQMVITAGHCVNEGGTNGTPGRYARNWIYIPDYRSGQRPLGTFQAKELRALTNWVNNSDLQSDVAMVTTHPLGGKKLIDVTGGNGLSVNYDHRQTVTAFGYSLDHDSAQLQRSCKKTAAPVGAPDNRVEIQCAFRGGGGPWLRNYSEAQQLGFVNGVVSTLVTGGWNRSSHFGPSVKALWDQQGPRT
ncbi:trypsin-like serine peptidase [Streptomyces sp. NPDC057638]|uniref:trypsin-like serine peptidase n=1 Tax=Streptomyces sp. NPDC057638 TaxID=3346190 RepID=UPI0036984C06